MALEVATSVLRTRSLRNAILIPQESVSVSQESVSVSQEHDLDPSGISLSLSGTAVLYFTRILLYSSTFANGRFAGLKINTTKKTAEAFAYGYTPCANDEVEIPVGNGKWNGIFGR